MGAPSRVLALVAQIDVLGWALLSLHLLLLQIQDQVRSEVHEAVVDVFCSFGRSLKKHHLFLIGQGLRLFGRNLLLCLQIRFIPCVRSTIPIKMRTAPGSA